MAVCTPIVLGEGRLAVQQLTTRVAALELFL